MSLQQEIVGVYFIGAPCINAYAHQLYCHIRAKTGLDSCPLDLLIRVSDAEFYGLDALPSTNQQNHTQCFTLSASTMIPGGKVASVTFVLALGRHIVSRTNTAASTEIHCKTF